MALTKRDIYIIFKILLPPTLISILAFTIFCLMSYLLTKEGPYSFIAGFPYKFYEQFKTSDSDIWGWTPINLILDIMLAWIFSAWDILFGFASFISRKENKNNLQYLLHLNLCSIHKKSPAAAGPGSL
jgi:hypothetical protein